LDGKRGQTLIKNSSGIRRDRPEKKKPWAKGSRVEFEQTDSPLALF
jgi:hypothetical protein